MQDGTDKLKPRRPRKRHNRCIRNKSTDFPTQVSQTDLQDDAAVKDNEYEGEMCMQNGGEATLCTDITKRLSKNNDLSLGNKNEQRGSAAKKSVNGSSKGIKEEKVGMKHYVKKDRKPRIRKPRISAKKESRVTEHINNNELQYPEDASLVNCNGRNESERLGQKVSQNSTEEEKVGHVGDEDVENATGVGDSRQRGNSNQTRSKSIRENNRTIGFESPVKNVHRKKKPRQKCASKGMNSSLKRSDLTQQDETPQDTGSQDGRKHQHKEENGTVLEGDGKQKNSRNEGQQFLKGIYIEVEGKILLKNVALGREEETATDCTRQHDKRHPLNRRRRRKLEETVGVGSDESSLPQNSGGLMRKHEAREEEGRVLLQNEEHQEKGVLVNSICASKKSPQQTVSKKCGTRKPVPRKQDQKSSQNKSERIEKRDEVLVKKSTLPQRDVSKRKDFEGQHGIRLPKNEFEMNEGLSLNYIPLPFKDRAKGKVDKSQDVPAHDQQRHQENWYEVMNTLEVSSGDNTELKQTCLLSEAMEDPVWKQSGDMKEQQGNLLCEIGGNRDEASNESKKLDVEEMPDVAQNKGPKVIIQCQEASSPQSKLPNIVKKGACNRKQSRSKKVNKKRSKLPKNADNGRVLGEKNVLSPQSNVGSKKSGGHTTLRADNSKSVDDDEQGGVEEKKAKENRDTIVQNGNQKNVKSGKAKEATNQRESPSVKVMKDLLDKSPEDIHCFILEHLPVLEKTQNIKDDGVIVLLKLLSKDCCCESRIYIDELLRSLQSSWLLNRRVMDLLNKMITGKPKDRNTQSVNLEIIKDILTVVAHGSDRFPKANVTSVLVKLHKATLNLVSSGKPLNKGVIIVLQELMRMKKKAELEGNREQRRRFPVNDTSTALTRRRRPPENFREVSIVPTAMDIVAVGGYDQGPFLRKNIVKGSYYSVEHYLDIQFRLLREDFLRPLREGIQLLMATPSDGKDDRLKDVRLYKNARILDPIFTSKGVRYKIKFDVSEFRRLEWENSKRLTYGSLLCLSKDNFKTFVFASVAERMLQDVRRGVIQIRVVSPTSEERLKRGDVYQMVESIAFFEAYRPVLIGLQMMSSADFPFKRYIVHVKNDEDVSPPSYLRTDNKQVLYDFAPIMHSEAKEAISARSNPNLDEGNDQPNEEDSGPKAEVLDLASWPSASDLNLDDSQLKALQLALTKEFAIIQGPPGTGKTYVGLKIVQMLLHNRNVWSINETGGPILVVCYTNHALDQFLEGILEFHSDPCGIIRVGGRSQSEKLKDRCLSILKKEMIKNKRMPKDLSCAFAEIKKEMNEIAALIVYHDKINEELKGRVFHEAELKEYASSMTSLQYDSLVKGSNHALTDTKESIIPEWLGLPVPPMDPYQDGFAKPLAMFPLNADCQHLEYFSQEEMAIVSDVYPGPGPEGHPQGSLQLKDISDSFIVIPNLSGGLVDAEKSITLLAFIYPLRESRMMISYHPDGLGVQLACEFDDEMGKLTASFIQRDLMPAEMPITAKVLEYNEWNFVGASYDFETGMAILWHNGSVVKSANIGKGLSLATQFDIKISVTDSSSSENKFSVRVSHLHIYGEALTSENIQAIGAISHNLGNTMTSCRDKRATPEGDEEADEEPSENDEDRGINTDQKWKSPSFKFDADVLEDQRILETDEVIQFNPRPWSDEPNTEATSSGTEMRAEWGSFQYQNARLMRKKIKDIIRKNLKKDDVMTKEEAAQVENVWEIADTSDRWCLYRRWVHDACESCHQTIFQFQEMFDEMADELQELRNQEDYEILKNADVVGMTTTGAAKNRNVLHDLKPVITIVEEAAEVFEAHTVTSLTPACQHLILIGDHQQLRPNPTVYDLQIKFALDVSLFERMVKNGIQFVRLGLQHRMRPEIATLLDHIYVEPRLRNHPSVLEFENVKGVERNLFFLDHTETEDHVKEGSSKSNLHEAKLLTALCRYLIQQGYEREQIAVLTAYSGQLLNVRREMSKDKDMFEGVRLTAVDSFQGEESDIILLSLVRSKRIGFLKIENRVCVALSRARKGFFIIGNAKLLEEQDTSGLWPKIISNLREQKSLGKHLKLVCQIHSQNVIEASKAEDFENAPEGGCREPCKYKMPDCEHRCPHHCHPVDTEHKEKYACQMPCTRTCDSGHLCRKVCSEDCGPCMVKVPKLIPQCNHEQQVPCSVDPSEFNCKHLVQKQAFPCGHTSWAECSMAPTAIICTEPCGNLECGHLCEGNCNTCLQGRLHQPCRNPCERILPCGHECVDACVRPCPPCSKTCRICQQKCCYPCRELGGNKKECPHDKHDQCYDEPSKRQECQKRCQEQLSCGHSCIGICGDVCPRLCYVCNAEEFRNSEKDAMFVELTDCGHVFEVNTLDLWIAGSSGEGDEHEIKQKQCPKCETRILHSVRYEEIVSDLNAVKRQILLSQVVSRIQLQNLREIVKNLKLTEMKEHFQKIESSLNNSTGLSFSLVSKCQNQVSFLKSLEKLYKVDNGNRTLDLHFLTARIMQERVCFSSQEIREFTQEITRTTLLVFLECIMTDLESRTCILSPDYERRVNSAKSVLASGKKIDHQEMELIFADLSKIKQRYSVHVLKDVKLTDSVSELLRDIVMTKHLAQEPWYKCSQGHVYSSADRNNEGDIKCPTCFAATAMTPKIHREVRPEPSVSLSRFCTVENN